VHEMYPKLPCMLILVGDHLASHKIEGRLSVTRQQVRKLGPKS